MSNTTVATSNEVFIPEADKVKNPKTAVFAHVILKGVQVGGFLGKFRIHDLMIIVNVCHSIFDCSKP